MTDESSSWRAEADDAWVAERRSWFMGWLRRRFKVLGGVGGAVSLADTGPYAGAPRHPRLRVGDEGAYSTIRHATGQVTYTTTSIGSGECPHCGERLIETHELEHIQGDNARVPVGVTTTCRGCRSGSWLLSSAMPTAIRARSTARKNVV